VAQAIKKNSGNTGYGLYETGDTVSGEKRFESVVQRYIWQGRDGIQGNGHIDGTGKYDRLLSGSGLNGATGPMTAPAYGSGGTWERIDGPDAPSYIPPTTWGTLNYSASSPFQAALENADNPLRPVAKYRTVYFHYLNE
jgi:ABC-type branched-subunit amino acid transport system substrate-binding protein